MGQLLKRNSSEFWGTGIAAALLAGGLLAGQGLVRSLRANPLPPAGSTVVAASSPYIDVHTHLDQKNAAGSVQVALQAMEAENAERLVFLPSPFSPDDPTRFDDEVLRSAEKGHRDKLAFLGGGGTLNVMIQEAVHAGKVSPAVEKKFKARAEEILRQGASGFGEMTAEHFATGPGTYYEYAPPDHPLFLLLADISAEHGGVPIDFHMEAVPQAMKLPAGLKSPPNPPELHANIAAFERLLAHNPRAKIVWAHAGWDNTGYRTAALCRRLLQAHPNLYMEIKVDPVAVGLNSPLSNGGSGTIKPEWLQLFRDFPGRFVIGSDQHYPEPPKGPQRWQSAILLFNQLPADLQRKIGRENAMRLYHLSGSAMAKN
jgi:predicted TIM-barrel fold metal-dependent hydrolase